MAAPTNVRVEATSITTDTIRWSYAGASAIAVYRSTDGSSYNEVTSVLASTRVAVGTTSYLDTGLTVGTKYWYKLSDDSGSTFSSVVTVWTHACPSDGSDQGSFPLPSITTDVVEPGQINEMARRIEDALNSTNTAPAPCIACPVDGAVVIDCSNGCANWQIIADQDINSVSVNWCNNVPFGNIDLIIPPNVTRQICGFPAGFGFSGDECTQAPIVSGSTGRTMRVGLTGNGAGGGVSLAGGSTGSKPSTSDGPGKTSGTGSGGGGGAGGGSGCTCIATRGALTIKSCRLGNSLDCGSTKTLALIACGGRGPYTWSKSGTVQLKGNTDLTAGNTANGSNITVTPPANPAPATAGTAYRLGVWIRCTTNGSNTMYVRDYGCDESVVQSTASDANNNQYNSSTCHYCGDGGVSACGVGDTSSTTQRTVSDCTGIPFQANEGTMCDKRTAGMISAGCVPCGLTVGNTVTVTDALGTSVSIIIGR
jgi:hypothetical protein